MGATFLERIGSLSPGAMGIAVDGARSTLVYDVSPFDIPAVFTEVLGDTSIDVGDGRLRRKLPKGHPQLAWHYAERISNIQGVGKPVTFDVGVSYEAPLVVNQIALYQKYRLTIDFLPRPYVLLDDSNIPVETATWVDEDGLAQIYLSTKEHQRFVDIDEDDDVDVVTAQHGRSVMRGGAANGKAFSGMPRITIPKSVIKMRWFAIPLRYVSSPNSYLRRFREYINQVDFLDWDAGSLLYKGYRFLRRYPQVVPATSPVFGTTAFTPDKLCDIEILFEHTTRRLAAVPAAPANGNWIPAGHNLFPNYKDRGYYYVTVDDPLATKQVPMYLSFPADILFTDPDA